MHRPQLDGLRAVCIIFTIAYHLPVSPTWLNGSVGVDVFFALSGWLITWLLMEEAKAGRIDLRAFYIRRLFRIAPIYFVGIGLYALASFGMAALGSTGDAREFASALPYLITFNSEYRTAAGGNIFGHAWTLGIEEKFYLLWPAILLFCGRRMLFALLISAGFSLAFIALSGGAGMVVRGYCGLGFGAGLAVLAARHARVAWSLSEPRTAGASMALIGFAYAGSIAFPHYAWNIAIAFFAAFLVAALWFNGEHPLSRLLAFRPLASLGTLTFAIYVVHPLCINVGDRILGKLGLAQFSALQFALGYAGSILTAYVLYRTVEKPLIQVGRRLALHARSDNIWSRRAPAQ